MSVSQFFYLRAKRVVKELERDQNSSPSKNQRSKHLSDQIGSVATFGRLKRRKLTERNPYVVGLREGVFFPISSKSCRSRQGSLFLSSLYIKNSKNFLPYLLLVVYCEDEMKKGSQKLSSYNIKNSKKVNLFLICVKDLLSSQQENTTGSPPFSSSIGGYN